MATHRDTSRPGAPSNRLPALAAAIWLALPAMLAADEPGAVLERPDVADAKAKAEAKEEPGTQWVRVVRDADRHPQAMQTSIVRYVPADGTRPGLVVDLIGAVHVGDRGYYKKLNQKFKQYDALLYELVAPKGTKVEKGRGTSSGHPVGLLQNGMKGMLELEHQLERIDYTPKNFVHADMSPKEFAAKMAERDESFLQMFFRMMGQSIAQQSKSQVGGGPSDVDFLFAMFDRNRPVRLKRIMAEQFEDMEEMLTAFGGPDGSTIITERNKVALKVLAKQIKQAPKKKKFGVFYGAGHLDDMDERLKKEFKLKPIQVEWLTAWDLSLPGEAKR